MYSKYLIAITGWNKGGVFAIIRSLFCATLAQLVEQRIRNAQVAGSIPAGGSK